ncbi:uncharacterized protein STEHIDRAFT_123126 [Stereum hirsutum FP-91666 SS1]|uniref:uncharacterized protein n=1 Tax=Stereum hirsutum (strain FP-91666) TaxID=721885 RepID=UPI000444A1DF|nr:uncharacterized protein STEHIDRAFT_123126 [Stereum hirsutum FP-91666 SS1]EIM84310.1 hypothetical protein STEHIDRAFT_123126 [Stereum hirsutum FP-91666 SS1]
MEGPDGDTLGGHMVQEIRNYHRTCFAGMKERGEARWLSSDLTEGTMTRFCEDSAKRFPVVRLCVDGWKARELLRKAWPGWAQDHLPDLNPAGLGKSKKGKRAKAESVLDDSDPETNEMTQIDMNSLIRMPAKDEDKEAVSVVATLTGPPPSLRVDPAIPVIIAAPLFPSVVAHAPPSASSSGAIDFARHRDNTSEPHDIVNTIPSTEQDVGCDSSVDISVSTSLAKRTRSVSDAGNNVPASDDESVKRRKLEPASVADTTSQDDTPRASSSATPTATAFSSFVFKRLHPTPIPIFVAPGSSEGSRPPTKASHAGSSKPAKKVKPKVVAADLPIYPSENVVTARQLQLREWLDTQEVGATKAQFAVFSSSITKEVMKADNKRIADLKAQGVTTLGEWKHPTHK